MASALDVKKVEVELLKVQAARNELECKILEREEDIARIREHISIQLKKEKELSDKLLSLKGDK